MTATSPPSSAAPPFSGLAWLGLALIWVALVRVPLILNAKAHLDSDLAVDGLTLLEAVQGHWRWHYPATPFIGSAPVLLSIAQAEVWGVNPSTLVSGGAVAWAWLVVATFLLNRRAFGVKAACWGLVPLAFGSTGLVWLSGRVTGGHLLAVAWHAGAFAILANVLIRGGWRRALALGVWSGFGLAIDTMFAVTWVGLGVASVVAWWGGNRAGPGRSLACLLAFGLGAGVGLAPRIIGQRVDPHDAYLGQFSPTLRGEILAKNAKLLALDCLPRLVSGHRLPWLQAEPDPSTLAAGASRSITEKDRGIPWLALAVAVVAIGGFARGMVGLLFGSTSPPDVAPALLSVSRGIRWGLLASSLSVVAGFLVSPNLSNSDNYRYLVLLVIPGASGLGIWLASVGSRGPRGLLLAGALALGFASLMTADTARWYTRFGWLDGSFRPIRVEVRDPALDWLEGHPQVTLILGNYWDVYRLGFLTEGRVRPVPFPQFPDRFPEIGREPRNGRPSVVIVRDDTFGPVYRARALAAGAREIYRADGLSIVDWPEGMRP